MQDVATLLAELVVDRWTLSGHEYAVRFWRRPLQAILGALTDAGFAIDAVREPQPLPQCRERCPDVWEQLARRPEFLLVRGSRCGTCTQT